MREDPYIIRSNIGHYEAMLRLDLDDRKRSIIKRLLAQARLALALALEDEGLTKDI